MNDCSSLAFQMMCWLPRARRPSQSPHSSSGPLTILPLPEIFTGTTSSLHHTVTSPPHAPHHGIMTSPQTNSAPQVRLTAEHNTLHRSLALHTDSLLKSNPSRYAAGAQQVSHAAFCRRSDASRGLLPLAPPPRLLPRDFALLFPRQDMQTCK